MAPSAATPRTADSAPGVTVAVVGGGIAGLSAAWELTSATPGTHVIVLESAARLGGKLHTGTIGGRAVDLGPDAFLARRPEAVDLCRELGLEDELVAPGSRRAFVWARGKLRPLPAGLALGVPTRLGPLARSGILSPFGVARAAVDLLGMASSSRAEPEHPLDRAVADITRGHLGYQVTARLVDPLIGGIHAGDTAHMSTAAVFPALLDAAVRGGSIMRALRPIPNAATPTTRGHNAADGAEPPVFHSLRGGLSRLVDGLAGALATRHVDVRLGCAVDRVELEVPQGDPSRLAPRRPARWLVHTAGGTVDADAVVLATPAPAAAALLEPVDRTLATLLGAIEYADVTLVTLRFPEQAVGRTLEGTGFLVPASAGCLITACTWLTSKWPELQRPGDVVVRASMGRFGDDRPAPMSDDEIVRRTLEDLEPMLDLRSPPIEAVVTRWPQAFPQYGVGHVERVSAIEAAVARLPALACAGAAYHGVGIPACIADGRRAAAAVLGRAVASRRTAT